MSDIGKSADQFVVAGVSADPEPDDLIALADTHRSIVTIDSDGKYRLHRMNLLKAQTRMMRVLPEQPVRHPSLALYRCGQPTECSFEGRARS
jgi:hypothetical protein